MNNDANSNELPIENADANSQEANLRTQENDNSINTTIENVAQAVDYQKKFSESAKEAQRLYEENKRLKEQFELKGNQIQATVSTTDSYYPGFEDLDEEAKNNLIAYTNTVEKRVLGEINKNPAIAFAAKQYNEQFFNNALNNTVKEYPELANSIDEFKSKYYNVNNVPQNIETILKDVAKIHLYDKAKEIGAKEQAELSNRIDTERTTAGSKDPTARRSLEDWNRMAQDNPTMFRSLSKEFNDDMQSGRI